MLDLHGIECVRGGRSLFSGLTLSLSPGELLRVRGANGAGKTSLLRLICGLASPAQGQVRWQGEPIGRLREEFNRQMVYIGHGAALKDDLSVLENLRVACLLGGLAPTDADALRALAVAGLRGCERAAARQLSQGQRRRISLARLVIGMRAPLWVLDEPFNALDTAATAWLAGLLQAHVAGGGLAVLTSHQDVAFDAPLAQREVTL